jgi:hypothetical protein
MKTRYLLPVIVFALWFAAAPAVSNAVPRKDSDLDGLPDKWEMKPRKKKNGKRGKPKGPLKNLVKLGAKPKHRDVFVEVDAATDVDRATAVTCGDLDELVAAFAGAPLMNPDGTTGINLHIDAGIECASRDYTLGGASTFAATQPCANPSDGSNSIAENRFQVFHQAMLVNNLCVAEGVATATDFMLNANPSSDFGYVFMHELGHVFGLDHGNVNSFSVMSGGVYGPPGGNNRVLDFNRYPVEALNVAALSEVNGLLSTPEGETHLAKFYARYYCPSQGGGLFTQGTANATVAWNCSGAPFYNPMDPSPIEAGTVPGDLSGDGDFDDVIPAAPAEWPLLNLANGRIGG